MYLCPCHAVMPEIIMKSVGINLFKCSDKCYCVYRLTKGKLEIVRRGAIHKTVMALDHGFPTAAKPTSQSNTKKRTT